MNTEIIEVRGWSALNELLDRLEYTGVEYNPEYLCVDHELGLYEVEVVVE